MQGERCPGDEHESGDDPLRVGTEAGDRGRFGTETTRRHRRKGVGHRLKQVHVPGPKHQDLQQSKSDVYPPEALGRLSKTRCQSVGLRTGRLGFGQLNSADTEKGKNRNRQDDHTHSAQPLGTGSPNQDAVGQLRGIGNDRGARRCESGCGFEECVREAGDRSGEQIGEGSEEGHYEPGESNSGESLLGGEDSVSPDVAPGNEAHHDGHRRRGENLTGFRPLLISNRDERGRHHCQPTCRHHRPDDERQSASHRILLGCARCAWGGHQPVKSFSTSWMADGRAKRMRRSRAWISVAP